MRTAALLLDRDLSVRFGSRELSEPGPGELVIQVDWAGICGSDLHVLRTGDWVAYWPATLGHEVSGRVARSGSAEFPVGAAVVLDSRIPVRTENGTLKADRLDKDLQWLGEARPGGFAEAIVVPEASVRRVPDGLGTEDAVLAEPLAVAMCALDQVPRTPASVLILGHGPVGALSHAEAGRRWPGAEITVVEPNERRADLAAAMGARVRAVLEQDDTFDLVIDAAGYPDSLTDAVRSATHGGTVLLVALGHAPANLTSSDIVERALVLVGSVGFDDHHLADALGLLASAPERYRPLVTHRVDLADIPRFLADNGLQEAIKVLVRCSR